VTAKIGRLAAVLSIALVIGLVLNLGLSNLNIQNRARVTHLNSEIVKTYLIEAKGESWSKAEIYFFRTTQLSVTNAATRGDSDYLVRLLEGKFARIRVRWELNSGVGRVESISEYLTRRNILQRIWPK